MANLYASYTYEEIPASDLTATDLQREAQNFHGHVIECARVRFQGHAEHSDVLFLPGIKRGGIAHGADALWTDCYSIRECIGRYVQGKMIE